MSKLVKTCPNGSKHVQIDLNMSILIKIKFDPNGCNEKSASRVQVLQRAVGKIVQLTLFFQICLNL